MSAKPLSFYGLLHPSNASSGSATSSSGGSSPDVFFDASDHLPVAQLTSTSTLIPRCKKEFHDASETPPAGVNIYIDNFWTQELREHGEHNGEAKAPFTSKDSTESVTDLEGNKFDTEQNLSGKGCNFADSHEGKFIDSETPKLDEKEKNNMLFQRVITTKNYASGEMIDSLNMNNQNVFSRFSEIHQISKEYKTEAGEVKESTVAQGKSPTPSLLETTNTQMYQRPKLHCLHTGFLPQWRQVQLGSTLREETRKVVLMLANDKACKIERPSLGLQDRLQSLAQRSIGKRTSYVKGPRVCSTLVKSIVKRTQERSQQFQRGSFQSLVNLQNERLPQAGFSKSFQSPVSVGKCSSKASGREETTLGGTQISSITRDELRIKLHKTEVNGVDATVEIGLDSSSPMCDPLTQHFNSPDIPQYNVTDDRTKHIPGANTLIISNDSVNVRENACDDSTVIISENEVTSLSSSFSDTKPQIPVLNCLEDPQIKVEDDVCYNSITSIIEKESISCKGSLVNTEPQIPVLTSLRDLQIQHLTVSRRPSLPYNTPTSVIKDATSDTEEAKRTPEKALNDILAQASVPQNNKTTEENIGRGTSVSRCLQNNTYAMFSITNVNNNKHANSSTDTTAEDTKMEPPCIITTGGDKETPLSIQNNLVTYKQGPNNSSKVTDLRKHIASLNKVYHRPRVVNKENKNLSSFAAASRDIPVTPMQDPPSPTLEKLTVSLSEVNNSLFEAAANDGGRDHSESSSINIKLCSCPATLMENVAGHKEKDMLQRDPDLPKTLPGQTAASIAHKENSAECGNSQILQNISHRGLLFMDMEKQSPVFSTTHQTVMHTDALTKLKTENLVARHGGKKHPYPPYQLLEKPPVENESFKIITINKGNEVFTDQSNTSMDCAPLSLHDETEGKGLPPIPSHVQSKKKSPSVNSWSRQGCKEESPHDSRNTEINNSPNQAPHKAERKCSGASIPKAHSRNGSIDCGYLGRRNSHLKHTRPGSRHGSSRISFSHDTLRKCLMVAVDKCYNTEWEETCDSDIIKNNLSQEDLNKSLSKAVCSHDAEKVRVLLKLGGDPNVMCGHTPALIRAAKEGALYVIQALLAAGADVDARTDMGNSPLHIAARSGYSEVVIQLVHSGAFVDAINRSGVTPLQMALAHGHIDVARSLLRLNADMFLQNKIGESSCDVANQLGYIGLSSSPQEIRRDSGVGTKVEPPSTIVPVAVRMIQGIEIGCAGTVDDCLREGAEPNTILPLALHWPANASVLHRAAHHGHDLIVRLLLAVGATIDRKDAVGNTPLHVAAQAGHNQVVKRLLDHGAPLEAASQSGMTPLHRAASKGKELTCNLLLRRGCNPLAEDNTGRTPADWARKRGYKQLSKKLKYRRKSSETLMAEGDGKLCLQHLHRLHEAALKAPLHQPEPMDLKE